MNAIATCPKCGTKLPPDAPSGVCPQCLLQAGLITAASQRPVDHSTLPYDGQARNGSLPEAGLRIKYFGDYELLREIARGGMGVVYKARQVRLNRVVALKMILAGQFASSIDIQRFQTEAEAAAQLDHPGIVPIFEVGEHEGHHFFSMGLVEGDSLATKLADGPFPPRDAAELVRKVPEAVQYAHDRGVIHRDLKPANILLTGPGEPRVTDFGLAKKSQGDSNLTATGQILGTPSFMSPEQAAGRTDQVNIPTDIYALGAILYATLTGRPPFQANSPVDTLMQVIEREPVSPRELNPSISRDLETICLKSLEKDRRRRYATARELGEELQRYLDGRPILARRVSIASRTWRWSRRNPVATAALLAISLLFVTAAVAAIRIESEREAALYERGIAVDERERADEQRREVERQRLLAQDQRKEAERQRNLAQDEKRFARQNLVASHLLLGKTARESGDMAEAISWYLHAYLNSSPEDPTRLSARNLIGAWGGDLKHTLVHSGGVHTLGVSRDGRTAIAGYFGSRSQLWNLETGKPIGTSQGHAGDIVSAEISSDGKLALIGDWSGATVWDTATGKQRYPRITHFVREDTVLGPSFSPDGRSIVTRSTLEGIRLWDADIGKPKSPPLPHGHEVYRMLFSPDSKRVASLGGWVAKIWDVETGKLLDTVPGETRDLSFQPEGRLVAVCRKDGKVFLRESDTGKPIAELPGETPSSSVHFDAKGINLVTTGPENATLWLDVASDKRVRRQLPHVPGLDTAAFSPNGQLLMTASDTLLRVWGIKGERPIWSRSVQGDPRTHDGRMKSVSFSPDGTSLLVLTQDNTAQVFATGDGQLLLQEHHVRRAVYSADGKTLCTGSPDDGWVRVRSVSPASRRLSINPEGIRGVRSFVLSPDGQLAALFGEGGARLYRTDTWKPVGGHLAHSSPLTSADFSPDGRTLVTSAFVGERKSLHDTFTGELRFWDVTKGVPIGDPIPLKTVAHPVMFDASGEKIHTGRWEADALYDLKSRKLLALEAPDATKGRRAVAHMVRGLRSLLPMLWDDKAGEPTRLSLPIDDATDVVITQDGRRLLTQQKKDRESCSRLWDAASRQPLGPEFQPDGSPGARTDDGRFVVYWSSSRMRIWDTVTGRPCGEPLLEKIAHHFAAFSPSGGMLATRWNWETHLWDTATGQSLAPPVMLPSNGGEGPIFTPDGKRMFLVSHYLMGWRVPQPAADDPERLRLSVEVRTGLEVDESGTLRKLTPTKWLERKDRLERLGGPCDILE